MACSLRGKKTGECCCAAKRRGATGGLEKSSRRACGAPVAVACAVGLLWALSTARLVGAVSNDARPPIEGEREGESRFDLDELRRKCVRSNARESDARSCREQSSE